MAKNTAIVIQKVFQFSLNGCGNDRVHITTLPEEIHILSTPSAIHDGWSEIVDPDLRVHSLDNCGEYVEGNLLKLEHISSYLK